MEYIFHYLCPVKTKDPRKETQIEQATLALVAESGLAGLTMAGIAKKAGIGMGTLYVYFKSKEELVSALYTKLKGANIGRILAVDPEGLPYPVLLRRVWVNYIQDRLQYGAEHFFIDQCTNSPYLDATAQKVSAQTYAAFHALLDLGKKQLLVKDLDNELLTAHLVGSVNELAALLLRQGRKKPTGAFIEKGFALAWDSIKR